MKYDANQSLYLNKLWNSVEGRSILTYTIRELAEEAIAPTYFPTAFTINPNPVPTDASGKASFTVTAKSPEHSTMADLIAPLGEGRPAEEGQEQSYSGSIADFLAPTWSETTPERKYKQDLFAELGDDAPLLQGFATDVLAPRIKSLYMSLDFMALRAETTGRVFYDKGAGNKAAIYKADIPAENFHKAGAKAWTDPDCRLLDQMVKIEQEYVDLWGVNFSRQWKVTKDMFKNVIMKNAQVIDTIKMNWLLDKGIATDSTSSVSNFVITEENFNKYVVAAIDGLSPIRVIDAKQMDNGQVVDPWEPGIAVLCPAGMAGEILRTNLLETQMYDKDMLNNAVSINWSTTANGLITVFNYVQPSGLFKTFYSKCRMSAVPVLQDWLFRVLVQTTEAE